MQDGSLHTHCLNAESWPSSEEHFRTV